MSLKTRRKADARRKNAAELFIFSFLMLVWIYTLSTTSLTEPIARTVAANSGLTDVEVGKAVPNVLYFKCGMNDASRRMLSGTDADGDRVSAVVCSGWLAPATVHYL